MDVFWSNTIINQKVLKCVKPEGERRGKKEWGWDRYFFVSAICINVPRKRKKEGSDFA